jgi:hypothetical protein
MKGTINGQVQVFNVLIDTTIVQQGGLQGATETWTLTAYYMLNSNGWTYLSQWQTTRNDGNLPVVSVQFWRMSNGNTYDTVVGVVPGSYLSGSAAYHDFGAGFYFSSPSVEQINIKAVANSQYQTELGGMRTNDYLTYG